LVEQALMPVDNIKLSKRDGRRQTSNLDFLRILTFAFATAPPFHSPRRALLAFILLIPNLHLAHLSSQTTPQTQTALRNPQKYLASRPTLVTGLPDPMS